MSTGFVRVASLADLPDGEARVVEVGSVRVALCRLGDKVYAINDTCTHDDGPLGNGTLDGHEIECPRHGARFDVRTGAVLRMPAAFPVRTYPTRVQDGQVEVDLGGAQP